ncbi:MAG TPA: tRNA (N6-isopentenyl adenosine(37)-C2)-methylthiotransferase MiaB [Candidatus Hydrothermia bacterium]|nr:tRNA (N6-isopentenyl adenosine(37)-C2)-methylthiotransferase MiaB [Candidatus Hydrothermia bacterium]HOK22796.1 tRNA (N6-isopentenyl adenosine(37)-C2)-methylthiotransferase MiaB [Candidatus Hydrothermia bacterium]HOL23505.1 tRNA (N6-isopentenyl adenosine(37)-C2)-methylthiotransferase MiaB [Candidatus Hydrothermia bacterium]
MSFYIITFGCQMNEYDSRIIENLMIKEGFTPSKDANNADIVIVNTCSVRGKPESKGIETARSFKRKGKYVVLTGCTAQQRSEELLEVADLVVGTREFQVIPHALKKKLDRRMYLDLKGMCDFYFSGRRTNKVLEYVAIQEGCDNFCSYCVVPYTRGREVSRPLEEIIKELKYLEDSGVKEVTLLGQNVNSYYYKGADFADLLKMVDEEVKIPRIYFTTSHPRDISLKVIRTIKDARYLKPWFHLPLQAGSDKVLKEMNRGYTKDEYLEIALRIRAEVPEATISTDIMVGFPGEGDEDFAETLDVVKKVQFDNAYMFMYSIRKPSPIYFKNKDISIDDVKVGVRLRTLISEVNKGIYQRRKLMLGKEYEILIYGPARKSPKYSKGKTENNITVVVPGAFSEGEFVKVKVEKIIGLTPIGYPLNVLASLTNDFPLNRGG